MEWVITIIVIIIIIIIITISVALCSARKGQLKGAARSVSTPAMLLEASFDTHVLVRHTSTTLSVCWLRPPWQLAANATLAAVGVAGGDTASSSSGAPATWLRHRSSALSTAASASRLRGVEHCSSCSLSSS